MIPVLRQLPSLPNPPIAGLARGRYTFIDCAMTLRGSGADVLAS